MPTIPFAAESIDDLRQRYPAALEFVYDSEKIAATGAIRPGEVAAQIFDCEDGLRLIISRQRVEELDSDFNLTGGKVVILHISASVAMPSEIFERLKRMVTRIGSVKMLAHWCEFVEARFIELSGNGKPLEFIGFDGQVGHWMQEE